jgi:hypothetical protein
MSGHWSHYCMRFDRRVAILAGCERNENSMARGRSVIVAISDQILQRHAELRVWVWSSMWLEKS